MYAYLAVFVEQRQVPLEKSEVLTLRRHEHGAVDAARPAGLHADARGEQQARIASIAYHFWLTKDNVEHGRKRGCGVVDRAIRDHGAVDGDDVRKRPPLEAARHDGVQQVLRCRRRLATLEQRGADTTHQQRCQKQHWHRLRHVSLLLGGQTFKCSLNKRVPPLVPLFSVAFLLLLFRPVHIFACLQHSVTGAARGTQQAERLGAKVFMCMTQATMRTMP